MLILPTLALAAATQALAFELPDHKEITLQAVRELEICRPGAVAPDVADALVRANLDEDRNLIVKWVEYSHYYDPDRPISMRRKSSLDRVRNLEERLERASTEDETISLAGRVVHHLQDSAVPPHVLPIQHGPSDGFERFEPGRIPAPTAAELDCAEFSSAAGGEPERRLEELLQDSARETLKAAAGPLDAFDQASGAPRTLSWTWFWKDGSGGGFGAYGSCGNAFGETEISCGSDRYRVDLKTYEGFKRRQVRQAIQATKKALAWILFRVPSRRIEQSVARGAPFDPAIVLP